MAGEAIVQKGWRLVMIEINRGTAFDSRRRAVTCNNGSRSGIAGATVNPFQGVSFPDLPPIIIKSRCDDSSSRHLEWVNWGPL